MMFPMRVYIKEYYQGNVRHERDDWFWKSLCIVYDNEALGFLERLLSQSSIEHKSESVHEPYES